MPLQIRRGTNAERLAMTQPLAPGELLFVTTPGSERLYIGNGSTLGGVQITGYTDADAKDAAAAMITGGTHSGISFSYNTITDILSATVNLSNYTGTINASALKGSIFADDSSLLVDTIESKIYAANGFFGNVTGNLTGNVSGNVTGNVSGNVTGNLTGNVTGNLNGTLDGDVTGSVFADNSTLLVDGVEGRIVGPVFANVTGNILATDSNTIINATTKQATLTQITMQSPSTINGDVLFTTTNGNTIASLSDGSNPNAFNLNLPVFLNSATFGATLLLQKSRGSIVSQTIVQNGDILGAITISGHDGTNFKPVVNLISYVEGAVTAGQTPPGKLEISIGNGTNETTTVKFKPTATEFILPPKLPVVADDTARTALVATPTKGMMILMESGTTPAATNKVQVFDGSAWVNLH